MSSELGRPIVANALRVFPPEIHNSIYTAIFQKDPNSEYEAILVALPGDPELYFEALKVYYEVKKVTIKMFNALNIGSVLPSSSESLQLVKNLRVKHIRYHSKNPTAGMVQGVDLISTLPCVEVLKYLHCDAEMLVSDLFSAPLSLRHCVTIATYSAGLGYA